MTNAQGHTRIVYRAYKMVGYITGSAQHNAHSTIMQKRRRLLYGDVENCVADIVDQIEQEHSKNLVWVKEHDRFVYKQRGSINLQTKCECAFWFENDSDYCCDQTCTVHVVTCMHNNVRVVVNNDCRDIM